MKADGHFHAPQSLRLRNKPSTHWMGGRLEPRGIRNLFRKEKMSLVPAAIELCIIQPVHNISNEPHLSFTVGRPSIYEGRTESHEQQFFVK